MSSPLSLATCLGASHCRDDVPCVRMGQKVTPQADDWLHENYRASASSEAFVRAIVTLPEYEVRTACSTLMHRRGVHIFCSLPTRLNAWPAALLRRLHPRDARGGPCTTKLY